MKTFQGQLSTQSVSNTQCVFSWKYIIISFGFYDYEDDLTTRHKVSSSLQPLTCDLHHPDVSPHDVFAILISKLR